MTISQLQTTPLTWEQKIVCGDDSYLSYYMDFNCNYEIDDLDEWKACEGLLEYKDAPQMIPGEQPNDERNYED